MIQKLSSLLRPLMKSLVILGLVVVLVLGTTSPALAARSGGRIGGGSFRMPRTYSAPSRSYQAPNAYRGYPGGGGFFFLPFFGFGGGLGGLLTIFVVITVANVLLQGWRRFSGEETTDENGLAPTVSVAQVQVGLLAAATSLKADLDRMAQAANTQSTAGLAQVLQETTLSLLRHPEYWAYGTVESKQTNAALAEAEFNRRALTERSKVTEETLSNVNRQDHPSTSTLKTAEVGALDSSTGPDEYIVVTLLVGTQGKLSLPKVTNVEELRQALSQLGSVAADRLLALEILWTPQAAGDTLSADDLVTHYPNLKLI